MTRENIHATAILLDGKGVLIRGPSGSGKSLLALYLLDAFASRGREAALISDDRVDLELEGTKIRLHAPKTIAGLIELRGHGIVRRPHRDGVTLDLVVDLVPALERMPEEHDFKVRLLGLEIARCPVPQAGVIGIEHQRLLIEEALGAIAIPSGG
ncbi:serine/threonine protein kinase [Devosia sp.]|uniref:HPr kinase/phosphorylase n=1 Tax=Devosia sp. TaxID=1871048 RepID=UPI001AD3AACB|nr:serine/threonine protein kinase [Devosia sp.]MBN9333530.1 serine/threonine protein kinase [Devosia sp.]